MSRTFRNGLAIALAVTGALALGACAASPRQRPVGVGDVGTGAGSLQAVRKQLAGTWTLTRFEVLNPAGQLQPVRAKAQLTYDDFGNMSIKGVLEEPLPGQKSITDAPALMYEGRATIDTVRQELVLTGSSSVEPDPSILSKIGIDSRRKYSVTDKELVMSAMDPQGRVTSRATYSR
jgi:hypothetical protein